MGRRIEELEAEIRLDEHRYRTLQEIEGEIVQRVHRHGFAAVGQRIRLVVEMQGLAEKIRRKKIILKWARTSAGISTIWKPSQSIQSIFVTLRGLAVTAGVPVKLSSRPIAARSIFASSISRLSLTASDVFATSSGSVARRSQCRWSPSLATPMPERAPSSMPAPKPVCSNRPVCSLLSIQNFGNCSFLRAARFCSLIPSGSSETFLNSRYELPRHS